MVRLLEQTKRSDSRPFSTGGDRGGQAVYAGSSVDSRGTSGTKGTSPPSRTDLPGYSESGAERVRTGEFLLTPPAHRQGNKTRGFSRWMPTGCATAKSAGNRRNAVHAIDRTAPQSLLMRRHGRQLTHHVHSAKPPFLGTKR